MCCIACWQGVIELAKWDRSYINNLPDAAFAVLEPDYRTGKTTNKNARHLPHHSAEVKNGRSSKDHIDLPHLRNALARVDQIRPVTGSISRSALVQRARDHLEKHAEDLKVGGRGKQASMNSPRKRPDSPSSGSIKPGRLPVRPAGLTLIGDRLAGAVLSMPPIIIGESGMVNLEEEQKSILDVLRPTEDEMLRVPVRALSAAYLPAPKLDFSKAGVVKESTPLLVNQTVYPDHSHSVAEWLGVVEKSWYDADSTPEGLNALLKIDAAANPRITRGLLVKAIHSVSVNLFFDFEKSHPDLDGFWQRLGEEVDGEIVRVIVTRIHSYGEISLVWKSADPHARRLDMVA